VADKGSPEPASLPGELRDLLEVAGSSTEPQAWTAFLSSYSRFILYVARQIPRDYDVVMDRYAFVVDRLREQNYRRLRTFAADGRGKFTTWLLVVVRRLCLDHDRLKHGRAPAPGAPQSAPPRRLMEIVLDPELMDRFQAGGRLADEELEHSQTLARLREGIANLDPGDQLLLSLRYMDDRSAVEIASLMSLPTAFHVYRRLRRIHATLRSRLSGPPRPGTGRPRADQQTSAVQYRLGDQTQTSQDDDSHYTRIAVRVPGRRTAG
jgi:RNA polymerase sigma factor (sigma-70 family)